MKTTMVARCGDFSPRSFLQIVRIELGFSIVCQIDMERRWTALNPRFYGTSVGGHSPETYRKLWELYNELPTDGHTRALIPSDLEDGNRLIIMRNDDMVIATEDKDGEYGAEVFVAKDSLYFEALQGLFDALEADNQKDPTRDFLKNHHERDESE